MQKRAPSFPVTIGILGVESGIGCTHLGIALANYCSAFHHKKTALVELNSTLELASLSGKTDVVQFRLFGVDYYPAMTCSRLPSLINSGYDYLILDLGTPADDSILNEFLRCDKKLLLGSLSPWRKRCYGNFLSEFLQTNQNHGNFVYLALFGIKDDLIAFSHQYHIFMQGVPFIANPFQLEKTHFSFLEHLI